MNLTSDQAYAEMCRIDAAKQRLQDAVDNPSSTGLTAQTLSDVTVLLCALREQHDTKRWNIHEVDGELVICKGDHTTSDPCVYEYYVPRPVHYQAVHQAVHDALEQAAVVSKTAFMQFLQSRVNHGTLYATRMGDITKAVQEAIKALEDQ